RTRSVVVLWSECPPVVHDLHRLCTAVVHQELHLWCDRGSSMCRFLCLCSVLLLEPGVRPAPLTGTRWRWSEWATFGRRRVMVVDSADGDDRRCGRGRGREPVDGFGAP